MYETLVSSAGKSIGFPYGNSLSHPRTVGSRRKTVRFPAGAPSLHASVQTFPAEPATEESGRRRPASLYEVLRVKESASLTEIKMSYRSLAKMYHPDTSESDGRDFIEIHNAYATLSDQTARAIYDVSLGVQRRRILAGAVSRPVRFYTTRRWETDQCW